MLFANVGADEARTAGDEKIHGANLIRGGEVSSVLAFVFNLHGARLHGKMSLR